MSGYWGAPVAAGHKDWRLVLTRCGHRWSNSFALRDSYSITSSARSRIELGHRQAERLGGFEVDDDELLKFEKRNV
jgi:hypothetical protein